MAEDVMMYEAVICHYGHVINEQVAKDTIHKKK